MGVPKPSALREFVQVREGFSGGECSSRSEEANAASQEEAARTKSNIMGPWFPVRPIHSSLNFV